MKFILILTVSVIYLCACKVNVKQEDDSTEVDETSTSVATSNDQNISLTAPANFSDALHGDSLTDSPTFSWDTVDGAAGYEIAIGTTVGGTDLLDWVPVGTNTSYSAKQLTLQNSEIYYSSVRAFDAAGIKGPVSTGDGWQNLICPNGYIKVPGNETPGLGGSVYLEGTKSNYDWGNDPTVAISRKISDFCVMKYEAKNGGLHTAVSTATGFPWVSIRRQGAGADDDAQEACENNGSGYPEYQLIGNHHWQAIARNIESELENYDTSGVASDHGFNHGHANDGAGSPGGNSSTGALVADLEDENACAGIGNEPAESTMASPIILPSNCDGDWHINKRTHILTNGEVIWDISGNVYEWVRDIQPLSSQGSIGYIHLSTFDDRLKFGPSGDYSTHTGPHKGGLGRFFDGTAGAVFRGGEWFDGPAVGLFTTVLTGGSGYSDTSLGFRCVFAP